MWYNTTPFPNEVFDTWLSKLSGTEYKVLNVIIKQTLGWKDQTTVSERKECDWISLSQFQKKANISKRAVVSAIHTLVTEGAIVVFDERGNELNTPEKRRGKSKLYFRLSSGLIPISAHSARD